MTQTALHEIRNVRDGFEKTFSKCLQGTYVFDDTLEANRASKNSEPRLNHPIIHQPWVSETCL